MSSGGGSRKRRREEDSKDKLMCMRCFDVLTTKLRKRGVVPDPPKGIDQKETCGGLFVTFEKRDDDEYDLRGCIGALSEIGVLRGLDHYTTHSAFRDSRFDPISLDELEKLKVSVSLLEKFEEAEDAFDWEVGKHGIIINFSANCRSYSATYLPHVASEQGWNKHETINSLIRKSGYRSTVTNSLYDTISLTRYQSKKSEATYQEYESFCECRSLERD